MMTSRERAGAARLLLVDDEETNIRLLERILAQAGYTQVCGTVDPREVEQIVESFNPDLLLLDLRMPHMDGFAVLKQLAPRLHGGGYLPVLMLTGDATPETIRAALSLGAKDFVAKPFDATEVLLRIGNLLETRALYRVLEDQNGVLETRVAERTRDLENSQFEIVERLALAAEMRDDDTSRHTQRVGKLSAFLAEALGAGSHFVELIRRAAPMHDVGKIGIPDRILLKMGSLTDAEFEVMRSHTVIGARILSGGQSDLVRLAERIAHRHHERWNGDGYPDGLKGETIPFEARIVGLADVFDALTHRRLYRPAWPLQKVIAEIQSQSGHHFDPAVVEVLLETKCYEAMLAPAILNSTERAVAVSGLG